MVAIVYRGDPEKPLAPPMPKVFVQVALSESSNRSDLYEALIDTGADFTFVGESIVRDLDLEFVFESTLTTHTDEGPFQVEIYAGDLLLSDESNELLYPGVEFVCDIWEKDGIVLGRNLLNRLILQLDGIDGSGEILDDKDRQA